MHGVSNEHQTCRQQPSPSPDTYSLSRPFLVHRVRRIHNPAESQRVENERIADAKDCAAAIDAARLQSVVSSIREHLQADLAGLALVTDDETRFFAVDGDREDGCSSIPRSISIADYAIEQRENLVELVDLQQSQFATHPFVMRVPHASMYASCTLFSPNHYKVGTVFLMRSRQQLLTERERKFLSLAARTCESLLQRDEQHTQAALDNVAILCHELRNLINPAFILSNLLLKHDNAEPVKSLRSLITMLKGNMKKSMNMITDMQKKLCEERKARTKSDTASMLHAFDADHLTGGEAKDECPYGDRTCGNEQKGEIESPCTKPAFVKDMERLSNRSVVERYEQMHDRVISTWQEDVLFLGSGAALHQVFANLISNAHKYAEPGTYIYISTWTSREKQGDPKPSKVVFSVRDTGPGIRREHRSKLFSKGGNYLSSCEHGSDSTGLGLFICRNIIEKEHNGTICLNERYMKGCDFRIEIPIGNLSL